MKEKGKPSDSSIGRSSESEGELLSRLLGDEDLKSLTGFEAGVAGRRNELLFKITTEMDDTKSALKEAEELVQRLKKRLWQLEKIHRILTK